MNIDNLVGMANQIGEFFEAMPDREEALLGITDHIRKFWAPRMRQQLTTYRTDGHVDAFRPIVLEALRRHSILPTPVPVPVVEGEDGSASRRHDWEGDTES